ncbi:MAG: dTDP-4-dehydrorhamnose reductase [Chitinophagaceae bacterium]|nr:dTDP-4-dehydrorhamnose reductase [Chitinophagaceae bacterium]MCW5927698.1 dTDP-4-dehydrorhamnose reductase [Chitinophagaceae bacterium]
MSKPLIIVTGANGQLGLTIKDISEEYPGYRFRFLSREELPVDQPEVIRYVFGELSPSFCINCAAYTAVDLAETNREAAFRINAEAVGRLAAVCKSTGAGFIHISTDYVFNGESSIPYTTEDTTDPVNTYGASKARGEQLALENNPGSIIIRTSWVYSRHGKNFVKTMLHLMTTRDEIKVVADQTGAPTYAGDLAGVIMKIITQGADKPGIYHYSNKGSITWYEFAKAIREIAGKQCRVQPIPSSDFSTPAKRPAFSLLDTGKIENAYGIVIPDWRSSLEKCIKELT